VYPYAGVHLGVFSLSGVFRTDEDKDKTEEITKFSAQTLASGVSLGIYTGAGIFLQASLHYRALPFISYDGTFTEGPSATALTTFTLSTGFQFDVSTVADRASAKKTRRELVEESVRRCAKPESDTCGSELLDHVPEDDDYDDDKKDLETLIRTTKERIEVERFEQKKKLDEARHAEKCKPKESPDAKPDCAKKPQPTEITITGPVTITSPVTVKGEGAPAPAPKSE